jgi:hypothetical protein
LAGLDWLRTCTQFDNVQFSFSSKKLLYMENISNPTFTK